MSQPADRTELLFRQAMDCHIQGRDQEALALLDEAARLRPDHAGIWNNRGNILRDLKRPEEALKSFDQALALRPDAPSTIYNRANLLLLDLRRFGEALEAYERALTLQPDFAEAWNNRGNALWGLSRLGEALASFDRAIALKPDFTGAMNGRAQVLFEQGRTEEGIAQFMRASALLPPEDTLQAPAHKRRHDQEQAAYLAGLGSNRAATGGRVERAAITPGNSEAAGQWRTKKPQIAVIDNLLTAPALEALRRFCLEEKIWRAANAGGYLGAFPEHGFVSPLLGQIAAELGTAFPEIFHGHPLLYMWAFKYDSVLSGTAIHADEAAVNVNFWITPDEANLDPESGGLVLWDVAAPMDWDFAKFNSDSPAIYAFLEKEGAKSVTVPYRCNRAVIFDSDLFHETDKIRFKEGYLNRRINVTMLFGRRDRAQR
jgi:tetratricopeptide (TPR) repeat protein